MYKENVALKAKLKVLAEKVEEYRATEDAMRSTLLTAQRMAAKLVQEAQTEKENLLATARAQHENELRAMDAEIKAEEQKLVMAKQNLSDFIERSRSLCEQHAAFLSSLPELVPAVAVEAAVEEKSADDIQSDILSVFDVAEPAVDKEPTIVMEPLQFEAAEEVAAEPADELYVDDDVIPSDFKLSLDELKFGRNYSAED